MVVILLTIAGICTRLRGCQTLLGSFHELAIKVLWIL